MISQKLDARHQELKETDVELRVLYSDGQFPNCKTLGCGTFSSLLLKVTNFVILNLFPVAVSFLHKW